ncbi:MAG TPA: high-potential iron-sulfur protein [Woeseiaceae bacterium]|nr:high-potential iron-sulfur protein [Woeseiaceae bacterium]
MRQTRQPGSRRQFLMAIGGVALSLPFLGLAGCGREEAEPPPTTDTDPRDQGTDDPVPPGQPASELGQRPDQVGGPDPAREQGGDQPQQPQSVPPDAADMPKLEESDAMAQALGYKHDASDVNFEQFPSRADEDSLNEFCKNCVHYQASPDMQWAPCTIFPGKLVNADGWCSAWAARG